jgi:hypothetical protein
MKRTTLILGFALLVVATTLAITITFRNDPARGLADRAAATGESTGNPASPGQHPDRPALRSGHLRSGTRRASAPNRYEVTIPLEALAERSPAEQADYHRRVDAVQREARRKLERMTEEFELTSSQRAKMFPVLVRSTPGYDQAMQVGGISLSGDPLAPAGEEMHELFDPDQQVQLEDKEIDRQLWWQDIFARIEDDLVNSTGGMPIEGSADDPDPGTPDPVGSGEERVAPGSRGATTR